MINLAIHYNNLGVDTLCGRCNPNNPNNTSGGNGDKYRQASNEYELQPRYCPGSNIDVRDEQSGEPVRKRRKCMIDVEFQAKRTINGEEKTIHQIDSALALFQKALAFIVQNTELAYLQNGLKYHPNDDEGFLRYENENVRRQIISSTNPCDTGISLKGESSCSKQYIYWKAIKIGNEDDGDDDNASNSNLKYTNQQRCQKGHHSCGNNHNRGRQEPRPQGEYEALTKSIYHSMICIFNIGLCYQYKGMTAKAEQMKLMANYANPFAFGFNNNYYDFLNASIDHYTQAYELMTRFRLEDTSQYTFLMAMMNNLAATYGSLGQTSKVNICNRCLVQSLILVICSSERDGHLGQEVLSRTETKSVLRKEEDRTTFESFLSNVMYLMLGDGPNGDQRYSGNTVAEAA